MDDVPRGAAMERCIREACARAERMLEPYAPVAILSERYTEREPHPGGQEAFTIRGRLHWHNRPETWARVMVEITVNEPVLRPIEKRRVLHEYGESVDARVYVYSLEEVVSEKLRAVLHQSKILFERGWARSRARDYYDLWRVLGTCGDALDMTGFQSLMIQKCAVRDVSFTGPDDFFEPGVLMHVEDTWETWLGPLVPDLPAFETVVEELRPQISSLLPHPSDATSWNH